MKPRGNKYYINNYYWFAVGISQMQDDFQPTELKALTLYNFTNIAWRIGVFVADVNHNICFNSYRKALHKTSILCWSQFYLSVSKISPKALDRFQSHFKEITTGFTSKPDEHLEPTPFSRSLWKTYKNQRQLQSKLLEETTVVMITNIFCLMCKLFNIITL